MAKKENVYNGSQIIIDKPDIAYAKIVKLFAPKIINHKGISDKATILNNCKFGDDVIIYPMVYIGDDVRLGNNVVLFPGVFIGNNVGIGDDTIIYPIVTIMDGTIIGKI